VLGTLLAPILLGMFIIGRYYNEIGPNIRLAMDVQRADRQLKRLEEQKHHQGLGAFLTDYQGQLPPDKRLLVRVHVPRTTMPRVFMSPDQVAAMYIKELLAAKRKDDLNRFQAEKNPSVVLTTRIAVTLANEPYLRGMWAVPEQPPADFTETPELAELKQALDHAWPKRVEAAAPPLVVSPVLLAWFAIAIWPALWIVWAFITRGGLSLHLLGLDVVRHDGRPAARWQCAVRALIAWLPLVLLLCMTVWMQEAYPAQLNPSMAWMHWGVWWFAVLLLAGYVVLALEYPQGSLHDRLSGVYIVPR
jgi:hypothetical protein